MNTRPVGRVSHAREKKCDTHLSRLPPLAKKTQKRGEKGEMTLVVPVIDIKIVQCNYNNCIPD